MDEGGMAESETIKALAATIREQAATIARLAEQNLILMDALQSQGDSEDDPLGTL